MRSVKIESVSVNHITLPTGTVILSEQCVSFDQITFFETRHFKDSVFVVRGDVPQDAKVVYIGRIATTENGSRFLSDAEELDREQDTARVEAKRIAKMSVTPQQWLFQVLSESELDKLLAAKDKNSVLQRGLLRMSVCGNITKNIPWVTAFVNEMASKAVLTNDRVAAVLDLVMTGSP